MLPRMFKIHEFSSAAGELAAVHLRLQGDKLEIISGSDAWPLPQGAVRAVIARFGAPFDPSARITSVASLSLPDGERLQHVRHLAGYDVIARDYIVFECADAEPVCAMAATVAAALLHLGRAAAASV